MLASVELLNTRWKKLFIHPFYPSATTPFQTIVVYTALIFA